MERDGHGGADRRPRSNYDPPAAGGTRGRVHSLLRHAFRDEERAEEVALNLRRAIETAATAFDDATRGNHGELSLDVGIDPAGHPWILEMNAKPMVFDEPSIRKDARRRFREYCFARSDFLPSGRVPLPRSCRGDSVPGSIGLRRLGVEGERGEVTSLHCLRSGHR